MLKFKLNVAERKTLAKRMEELSATWSTFFTAAASSSARRLEDTSMWKRGWSRS